MLLLVWALGAGCAETVTTTVPRCTLEITLTPESAEVGELVTATGSPLTEGYDTFVVVGGVEADVLSVDRADCALCDACRDDSGCSTCSACVVCEETCSTCAEALQFIVPMAPPGDTFVTVVNAAGSTEMIPFTILGTSFVDTGHTGHTGVATDTADSADTAN
jgi:hypothetical protein